MNILENLVRSLRQLDEKEGSWDWLACFEALASSTGPAKYHELDASKVEVIGSRGLVDPTPALDPETAVVLKNVELFQS